MTECEKLDDCMHIRNADAKQSNGEVKTWLNAHGLLSK